MQHHHRPRPMLLHRRWVQPQESAVLRVRRAAGTVGHVPESGGSCHGARVFGERQQNSVGVQRFGSEKHEKTTNDNFEIDVQALFQLQSWSRFDLKFHVEIVFKPCN